MADVPREGAPIDRYVVLEYLSEGGMGAIYLGKKLGAGGFEKEVVLKQLLPEFMQQPEFVDLFLREARLSATLDHANIIHTIDLVTAGPEHFIVMEYLAGADLRTLLKKAKRRRKRFSAGAGIFIAREVLSALAYAHSKRSFDGSPLSLIHRDVSPSNVLVSYNGEVKLTDFGIAKASTHNSIFYRVKGKVGYMSPEQARSEPLDHRSDLYSLAVCLYEVVTGERLFVHAGLTATPDQIYSQPIALPSRKVPGLPADLDKVLLKALAIDPNGRYQTAGELQEALLRAAHKNGLLMSAPELAAHLRDVCGPPTEWREVDQREGTQGAAGGTEVYDIADDDDDDDEPQSASDLDSADLLSVVGPPPSDPRATGPQVLARRRPQHSTSTVAIGALKGLELTSMIKLGEAERVGAEPLIDLDDLGPLARIDDASVVALAERIDQSTVAPRPVAPRAAAPRGDTSGVPIGAAKIVPRAAEVPTDEVPPLAHKPATPARRRAWLPWLGVVVILIVGGAIALAIGLSGPGITAPAPGPAPAPAQIR